MNCIHRRVIELAPQRAKLMDDFDRGIGQGASHIIKQVGDEADILFGKFPD